MRPRTSFVLSVFLLSLIGFGTSASANVLPKGTILHVRTTQPIWADSVRAGSRIRGVVDRPVTVRRHVLIPSGSPATLEVVDRSSNLRRVDLSVRSIRVGRTRYVVSTNEVRLGGSGSRAERGLVGAGVGAVAGGMIGGGPGAVAGATTGAGIGMITDRRGRTQLSVPAHTRLQFRVNRATPMGR
jgi:hypothetical protein